MENNNENNENLSIGVMRKTWPYLAIKNYLTNDLGFDKAYVMSLIEERVSKLVNHILSDKFNSGEYKALFIETVTSHLNAERFQDRYSKNNLKTYVKDQVDQAVRDIIKDRIEVRVKE